MSYDMLYGVFRDFPEESAWFELIRGQIEPPKESVEAQGAKASNDAESDDEDLIICSEPGKASSDTNMDVAEDDDPIEVICPPSKRLRPDEETV